MHTYDVIRFHQSDRTCYLVMCVNLSERDCYAEIHEDMRKHTPDPALVRVWGNDAYGVIVNGVDAGKAVWSYLVKRHDEPLPPLGFWST